jgi:hypothetical protein
MLCGYLQNILLCDVGCMMLVQILVWVYPVRGLVRGLHSFVVRWTVPTVNT